MTTYPQAFTDAVDRLLDPQHEGGYSPPRPGDPGGETKFGISKRAYPQVDIKNLTRDQAVAIYFHDYWQQLVTGAMDLPPEIAGDMLDVTVNSGPARARKLLQAAIGVPSDGVWGPASAAALARWHGHGRVLAAVLTGYRLRFLASLPNWSLNSAGWSNRLAANLIDLGAGI